MLQHVTLHLPDATWATPIYLKPFELGIDATSHSVTKYISGYSDVLADKVTSEETHAERFTEFYKLLEIYTPAEEYYLVLRGLRSLEVRLRQHERSALEIARLTTHSLVHCTLPSHPEHHLWQRDFESASGLFAFTLREDYAETQLAALIDALQLFRLGFRWGGYQSLLNTTKAYRTLPCRCRDNTVTRLSIGFEDSADLCADLEKGLAMLVGMLWRC